MLRPFFALASIAFTLAPPAQACDQDVELDRMLPAVAKFERNKITPSNQEEIGERIRHICHYLGEHPDVVVVVQGFTAPNGSKEYTLHVGSDYAKWMRNRLILQGCDLHKITTISYGKDRPNGPDTAGMAPNRAEILLKRTSPKTAGTEQ